MVRNVVVSGGGTGIGRAAANMFAHRGDRVIIIGRRGEAIEEAASSINETIDPRARDV